MIRRRADFAASMKELDVRQLVFIDESGFKPTLHRAYGRSRRGKRVTLIAPKYGKNITFIGAIALDGVRSMVTLDGALNGERFVRYLAEELGPNLSPGDIVVMDGPSVHRVEGVKEALAMHGAKPLYLPPYSPEFNPIEMCWSVMKAWVRKRLAWSTGSLVEAANEGLRRVTSTMCVNWIRHSGYTVPSTQA